MNNLWEYFNGKKTIVGTCCLLTSAFGYQVVMGIWDIGATSYYFSNSLNTLDWLGMALGGIGLSHKAIKQKNGGQQ